MGTGRGRDTGPSADLKRRALFAVWDDDAALDWFLDTSPVAGRWQAAGEVWSARLRLINGHGAWGGRPILADLGPLEAASGGPTASASDGGPICTLTRANVRVRHWRTFASAARRTSVEVARADGLLRVVGVGEAPVGRQATFAIWQDDAALRRFANDNPVHREIMQRTRREGWYGEELFARFKPYASIGSWDGDDPFAAR